MRRVLPRHALLTLVRALIINKVDYCNSLLAGMSVQLHDSGMQSVLNAAARLIFTARRTDHISPLLRDLHWLRVREVVCWRTGVFTARHRRTSQTTYPLRLLMATAVTSGLLALQLWWLGLPDARRSATVRFPWQLHVLGTVSHQPSAMRHQFCLSGAD